MSANELQLNAAGDAIDLCSDFRARRDERAYTILQHAVAYVEMAYHAGHIGPDVLKAAQMDVLVAQLAIDIGRRE